jgi:hypothetical protein
MAINLAGLFSVGVFEEYGIKKFAHNSGTETAIQSENEEIYTETLTKVVNNFVLRLHVVCDFVHII